MKNKLLGMFLIIGLLFPMIAYAFQQSQLQQNQLVIKEPTKKIVYFDKYSSAHVPTEIIPPNAEKFIPQNDNEKNFLLSMSSYKWEEPGPKDSKCRIYIKYSRHTKATTAYGHGGDVMPEEAAYVNSLVYADDLLTTNPDFTAIELYNIPQHHLPSYYGDDPHALKKIIKDLRKMKSIPIGYVIFYNKRYDTYNFSASYANMTLDVSSSCSFSNKVKDIVLEHMKKRVKEIGIIAYNRLLGNPPLTAEQPVEKPKEVQKEQPKEESPKVRVIAMPSAAGDDLWSIAYLPATNKLPAKIIAETKPNTPVTFHIVKSPKDAYLVIGNKKGVTVEMKSDSKGIAEALFYYNGGKVTQPKKYEIKVSTGEERDIATVNVGLGLAFDKIKAVQGAYGDRHPFTLSLVSKYYPKLNLGLYFSSASRKVWNGQTVGVRLKPQWVNKTPDLPADKVFNGITKITPVMVSSGGNNVLTVLSYDSGEETVYNITKYAYPAVKMMSDGIHNYRIVGELVLTDEEGRDLGKIDETLIQSDALAVVSKETPEHFMVSLVCALEAQDTDQFLMLEYIKKIPVQGKYVDELLNVMGILCKFGKADYEGLFYDLNNYLGGKWLDHLTSPKVFERLTPRQQKAAQWAKAVFEREQDIKNRREYGEREVPSYGRLWIAVKPDHELKKLTLDPWLIAPALIDFERGEEEVKKMEEKEQKNKPIEAKFNNENLKKADEMKQQQNTQTQNTEGNVLEKAVNELKDVFRKLFK